LKKKKLLVRVSFCTFNSMDPLCVLPVRPVETVWAFISLEDTCRAARVNRQWLGALLQYCRRRVAAGDTFFYGYRCLLRAASTFTADAASAAEADAARLCRLTLRLRRRKTVAFETWTRELSVRACVRCLVGKDNIRMCAESPPLPLCRPCRTRGTHALSLVRSTEVFQGDARAFAANVDPALLRSAAARRSLMRHVHKTLTPVRLKETVHHYFRPALLRVTELWWRTKGKKRWGSAPATESESRHWQPGGAPSWG
jgi:hypothetical protein